MAEDTSYYQAIGRRKTSVATVQIREGTGEVKVNGKSLDDFFSREVLRYYVIQPFTAVDRVSRYNVVARVKGGGESGQAGAIRHGIAKALTLSEEQLRLPLKQQGFLTRDPRMKERKKYGQRGARARFQFSKR